MVAALFGPGDFPVYPGLIGIEYLLDLLFVEARCFEVAASSVEYMVEIAAEFFAQAD